MAADPARSTGDSRLRFSGARTHELFERHSRMVYGLCRALLRDPHDAEDATQAAFLSAHRALIAGTEPREPAAWLATIARNECAARARSRMREPLPLPDADIPYGDGPEAAAERNAMLAALRVAIAALPAQQREAVVLRDLYGLHYSEVGAALGVSLASVESLLFRARRRLRVSLKPLAGGALTVPIAVREGIAQAVPLVAPAVGSGGAVVAGAGLLGKLAVGPMAAKAVAGAAALVTASSLALAGADRHDREAAPSLRAAVPADPPAAALVEELNLERKATNTVHAPPVRAARVASTPRTTSKDSPRPAPAIVVPTVAPQATPVAPTNPAPQPEHAATPDDLGHGGTAGPGGGTNSGPGSHSGGDGESPSGGGGSGTSSRPGSGHAEEPGSGADGGTSTSTSSSSGPGGPAELESAASGEGGSAASGGDDTTSSSGPSGGDSHGGHGGGDDASSGPSERVDAQ